MKSSTGESRLGAAERKKQEPHGNPGVEEERSPREGPHGPTFQRLPLLWKKRSPTGPSWGTLLVYKHHVLRQAEESFPSRQQLVVIYWKPEGPEALRRRGPPSQRDSHSAASRTTSLPASWAPPQSDGQGAAAAVASPPTSGYSQHRPF